MALVGQVEFRLLGAVEVRRGGTPVALGGPRQRALLALLLLQPGRTVSAGRLIDELWAGHPPYGAGKTLRSYVSRLRTALGADVDAHWSAPGYAIQVAPEWVDTTRFEALVHHGRDALAAGNPRRAAARLRDALALWRGQPFTDVGAGGVLDVEAGRLTELRLRALELRIDADLALGASTDLLDELDTAVRDHPYREIFWRQLMTAMYRAGRQADALAAYRRARAALAELGLDPTPELRALESAVLRHELAPAIPPEVNHNLPAPLTSFVGRASELAEHTGALAKTRLLTLTGVGGVGKTRLAIEVARGVLGDFPDGVTFVDLAPLADPALLAGHIGATLGQRDLAGGTAAVRVADLLRPRTALLVLDNCEHLRDACAELVGALLQACPRLRILATSRELLGVPGEVVSPVPPLTSAEAVELFLTRARDASPGFGDDAATVETVARICADLDGLPLAIELAASRTRLLAPAEIAARLHDRFRFLVSRRKLAPARHRTLREAIDWSYQLLDADQQRLLRLLSVFAGGGTLEAVAAVAAAGDVGHVLDLLGSLVDASLVMVDTNAGPTRYRLLETVRQYAAARCEEADGGADLRRRHAVHYTDFAEAAARPLRTSSTQAVWVARVAADRENLRAALAWSHDTGDTDRLIRIAGALWWFWWIRGELDEGRAWLEAAVARPTTTDPGLRGEVLLGLAGLAWVQADFDAAERHGQAARRIFAGIGDQLSEGAAWNTLGLIAHGRLDLASARRRFESALEAYRSIGADTDAQRRNVAVTVDNLGSVAHELGEDDRSIALYAQARDINQALGAPERVAMNNLHLATVLGQRGNCDEARALIAGALPHFRAVAFVQYAVECLESASVIANRTARPRDAAFLLGASAAMRRQAGNPPVPFLARLRDRELDRARVAIGAAATDEAYAEGVGTPSDHAMVWTAAFLAAG